MTVQSIGIARPATRMGPIGITPMAYLRFGETMEDDTFEIVQVDFKVPKEIEAGLLDGRYFRVGGIVRNQSGEIVKHLEEVGGENSRNTLPMPAARPWLIGIGVLSFVAVTAGIAVYKIVRKNKDKKQDSYKTEISSNDAEISKSYNEVTSQYVSNMNGGTMTFENLCAFMSVIESLDASAKKNDIKIDISPNQLAVLQDLIRQYTSKLCEANHFACPNKTVLLEPKEIDNSTSQERIDNIQMCLSVQKSIFEKGGRSISASNVGLKRTEK